MRPLSEIIRILKEEMLAETGLRYTFMIVISNRDSLYRVIPERKDDGFYRSWFRLNRIKWHLDPIDAVAWFYQQRKQWRESKWPVRRLVKNTASLPASTWPHPGNTGSALR